MRRTRAAFTLARSSGESVSPDGVIRAIFFAPLGRALDSTHAKRGRAKDIVLSYSYAQQPRWDAGGDALARKFQSTEPPSHVSRASRAQTRVGQDCQAKSFCDKYDN